VNPLDLARPDAATLRRWAAVTTECLTCCPQYFQILRPLLSGLRGELTAAATIMERFEERAKGGAE
jgi:hypothetical protein